MFTGLIEEIGTITSITASSIEIQCKFCNELKLGDSISINGTCLTVTHISKKSFSADISPESYKVTNLKHKSVGDFVNLERAMSANSRLDGHLVYGHIDINAKVKNLTKTKDFVTLEIEIPQEYSQYVVQKGSIAIDGISLTIANHIDSTVEIAVIPHTWEFTTLKYLKISDFVNIEFDMIAKYIEKKLAVYDNKSRISVDFLKENGFA